VSVPFDGIAAVVFHSIGNQGSSTVANEKRINWIRMQNRFKAKLTVQRLNALAAELGVSTQSLERLGIGWSAEDQAWTFPERDHQRHIIGILRRYEDGEKMVISGGRRGIYLPKGWEEIPGPVFIPEGVSDVAALLSRGLCAVGRPAATGGVKELAQLFSDSKTEKTIVIVGENDRKPDGSWPGRDGAQKVAGKLAGLLGREVRWTMPPEGVKDVRELIQKRENDGD
jgi:hypothetical protein